MIDVIISIAISIIAAILYDVFKNAYLNREVDHETQIKRYSKKYVSSVKKEFYISFFLGITFTIIPNTKFETLNLLIDILSYFSFFISLMGFMCLVEVVNYLFDKDTNK